MGLINRELFPRPIIWPLVIMLIALYIQAWLSTNITATDFPPIYTSGRLLKSGENPYSRDIQCQVQAQIRPDLCMPSPHTPVLLPLLALISTEDYAASYNRWCMVLLLVLSVCAWVAYRLSGSLEAAICMVLFQPIFISITQANITPFILLAVFLWIWLLRCDKDILAGLALSLAVVKPQLALALALPMAFVRTKAFLGFCIGGSVFALMGLALVGVDGYRALLDTIGAMMRAEEPGTDPLKMFSVTGLLARSGWNRLLAWPIFAAAIIGITLLWRKKLNLSTQMFGIVLAVFVSPHLFTHDLSLLAVPLLFVNPVAPIIASCVLLLSQAAGVPYAGTYFVMGILGFFFWTNSGFKSDSRVDTPT